jgi:hypothetical protein
MKIKKSRTAVLTVSPILLLKLLLLYFIAKPLL